MLYPINPNILKNIMTTASVASASFNDMFYSLVSYK
jgi:hypothetical protein